jgi:hypothetical protein
MCSAILRRLVLQTPLLFQYKAVTGTVSEAISRMAGVCLQKFRGDSDYDGY